LSCERKGEKSESEVRKRERRKILSHEPAGFVESLLKG
jgi:hypothetical protein